MLLVLIILCCSLAVSLWFILAKPAPKKKSACFEVNVEVSKQQNPAFEVSVKGRLHNDSPDVSYTVYIYDETGGVNHPIHSDIGTLTPSKQQLSIQSPPMDLGKNTVLEDWTKIITIPVEKLKPSRNGLRTLKFKVQVNDQPCAAQDETVYDWNDAGFLDVQERLDDIYTSIFYMIAGLGTLISNPQALAEQVSEWLIHEGLTWPAEKQAFIARQFQRIVMDSEDSTDWEDACEHYALAIRLYANKEIRHRLTQLFFQILETAPDTISDTHRLEILFELSKSTGSDMGQFCRMAERVFPDSYHEMGTDYRFGLHNKMTNEDIQQRLRDEYKTWNSRVTHPNKQIRTQAEKMLNLIARKRCELTGANAA